MDARSASMSSAKTYCSMRDGVVPNRDFDEADEYCPNCDNHFVIDAETKKSKAIKEGKAGVVVGVQGNSEREVVELREQMMKKMMEEGIDEDLLDDSS